MSRLPPISTDDWSAYTAERFRTRALRQVAATLPPLPRETLPPPVATTRPATPPIGAPPPASTAASAAAVAPAPTERPAAGYRPSQLTMPNAMAVCGPAAALAFAARTGRTPTAEEAIELARQSGWTPGQGMAGPASEKALLDKMGIPSRLEHGVDWAKVRADVEQGNPVIIDTPGHYFVAEAFDPETGKFDFGTSATDLKGGSRFMSPDELNRTKMGPARSTLYLDNPDPATGPSVATRPQTPIQSEATATPDEIKGYVRAAAIARGIDPDVALRAADTEGGTNEPARRGTFATGSSWYPFQLHYGGKGYENLGTTAGMGNSFTAETGWQPGDPNGWKASVDYALDGVAKNGWGAWYGPAKIGITGRTGIAPDAAPLGVDPANLPGATPGTPLIAPEPAAPTSASADWLSSAQASVDSLETRYGGLLPKPNIAAPPVRTAPDFAALAQAQIDATFAEPNQPTRATTQVPFYRPPARPVPEAAPEPEPEAPPVEPPPPSSREADFYGPDALYGEGPAPAPYVEPSLPQRAAEAAGGAARAIGDLVPRVTPPPVTPPPVVLDTAPPQTELPDVGELAGQAAQAIGERLPTAAPGGREADFYGPDAVMAPEPVPEPPPAPPAAEHPLARVGSLLSEAGSALADAFRGGGVLGFQPGREYPPETLAELTDERGQLRRQQYGTSIEEHVPAFGELLNQPLPEAAQAVPIVGAMLRAGEQLAGRPVTTRDVLEQAGGGQAGFQLPFGLKGAGAVAEAVRAVRGAEEAAPAVARGAEAIAEAARPVARPAEQAAIEATAPELTAAGRGGGGRPPIERPPALPLPEPELPPGAAAGASEAAREFAGNIRLGKYAEDVQPVIEAAYDANPALFERARRGVVPDAEALANAAGVKVEQVVKRWKPGTAENNETIIALRETLSAQARAVGEAQAAARAVDSSENLAKLTEELTKYRAVQETVAGVTAEAGRALRSFRQPVTGELADQMLGRMLKLTTKDDIGAARKLLLDGLDLSDPVAVANAAKQLYQPTAWEKIRALWMNSLLSGPPGRIRDFLSSAYSVGTAPLERGLAVPIDVALSKFTGKRSIYAAEIPAEYAGMASAHNDAFRNAMRNLRHGFTPEQAARGDIEQIAHREVLPGALNLPGRLVGANDVYFKALSTEAASRAFAVNAAKSQGLRGEALGAEVERLLKERPQAMIDHATNVAKYRSFQSESELAKWLASMKNAPGPFAKAMTAVMPFHSTAIALAKYALERTPAGLVMMGLDARGGRLTQRAAAEGLARVGLGSSLMLEGYNLASDNRLTGAAPDDPAERDAFYRQHPAYSIRIGDRWYSYQFAPFAPLLAMSATIKRAVDKGETDNAASLWTAGALAAGKAMLDQPFMTGLQQLSDALDNPDRRFEAYAESWGRSAVPQVIQTVARASDNIMRDPQGPIEAALTGIPGASRLVPARLDPWGRDVVREPSGPGVFGDPFRTQTAKDDPVERELARLQLKDLKVEPGFIGPKQTIGKEEVTLTREQRASEQRIAGKIAYGMLAALVGGPEWQSMSDDKKDETIHKIYGQSRTAAREAIKPQLYEPAARQAVDRAKREVASAAAQG